MAWGLQGLSKPMASAEEALPIFHKRYIVSALISVRRGFLNMRLFLYVSVYALAIAGLCVAVAPANAAGL